MKKQITLFSSLLLAATAFSQTAITINATDMPIPGTFNLDDITSANPPNASLGNNQTWNYGTYAGTSSGQNVYIPETDAFFTNAGVDVYLNGFKALTSNLSYEIANEFDFNTNKVEDKGVYVYPQAYSLSSTTGNTMDSLVFPVQGHIFSQPRTIISFPFTTNSAWHSVSRAAVDFKLTVTSSGLNKTPGKHVYHTIQNDSIVGWGKLTVHTANGSSIPYDVLMNQSERYSIDSFYLAGSPAPAALMSAFGITQGQKTNVRYAYNFYRAGSFNYLMRLFFGSDNTYNAVQAVWIHTDNVTTTDVETAPAYSTLLYPNPTNGSQLNIQVLGKNIALTQYAVIDMMGRVVQTGEPQITGSESVSILLADNLVNGNYVIKVQDSDNQTVVIEKFDLLR